VTDICASNLAEGLDPSCHERRFVIEAWRGERPFRVVFGENVLFSLSHDIIKSAPPHERLQDALFLVASKKA
jgi:hypothetical protein